MENNDDFSDDMMLIKYLVRWPPRSVSSNPFTPDTPIFVPSP
jgi:hypothetical protein